MMIAIAYSLIKSALVRLTAVFVLSALLAVFNTAVPGQGRNSSQIQVDGEPIWAEIGIEMGARHWFIASDSKPYTIIAESYQSPLAVWIATSDGKALQIAEFVAEGQYRYRATIQAEKGARYQIGIGIKSDVSPPIGYRIGLYNSSKSELPQDPRLHMVNLQARTTYSSFSFDFSESRALFLNRHARYFQLQVENSGGEWIEANVSADSFAPEVILFNLTNQYFGDFLDSTSRDTAKTIANSVGIVVVGGDHSAEPNKLGSFDLEITRHELDPDRSFLKKIREFFSDPVINLITGLVVGIGITIIGIRLSIARKQLLYHLENDSLVLTSETTRDSQLSVLRNGNPVTDHVGMCTVSVRLGGHKDIRKDDLTEPLALSFGQMTNILRATAEATSGWAGISVPSGADATVQLSLTHLRPGDRILLNVFYTQEKLEHIEVEPNR